MKFSDKLETAVRKKNSCLILGLDPIMEKMPEKFSKDPNGILDFLKGVIEETEDMICGVKIQMAYFEVFGSKGVAAVEDLLKFCRDKDLITISDGKRGDIGSTSTAYAEAFLGKDVPMESDALTVNPFLGTDGVKPFVEFCEKNGRGIFVLVRTSNPSAVEFQGGENEISVKVANMVEDLGLTTLSDKNFFSSVGAVVGATLDPKFLEFWREEMPHTWMLCPGVGAQGGNVEDVLKLRKNGLGVLIPVSRSVLYAEDPKAEMQTLFEAQKV
ncbi:MAG: orotidine-5'-phosphate decarboxylase [Candidatus Peregrinibacteria bacterium]|nr:orotidine-5'-phosphate decarboxylase [Candidatus Peregrinibacteria bacterium]